MPTIVEATEKIAPAAPRARVLIADDHRAILARVAEMLDQDFCVIGAVTDGAQLLTAEAALHPDVLVVDISMPVMGGIEAAGRLRQRGSRVPVVCLTANAQPDLVEAAWEAGALGFVAKISMARDLVPAIRAALEGRRFVSTSILPSDSFSL